VGPRGPLGERPAQGRAGLDGGWRVVVMGAGPWVVPVDWALRRPAPGGAGAPCRAKLSGTRLRLEERLAALRRRGLGLPPPLVGGERWWSASTVRRHGGQQPQGPGRVAGKQSEVLP
jgi:hypothetical protein